MLKKVSKIILTALLFGVGYVHGQGIAINETGTVPEDDAILDVQSTDKGFLPPRMTTTERDAINGGVFTEGLTIYNTTVNCLQWYVGNGIWHDGCGDNPYLQYPEGTVFCESGPTEIVDVFNPSTGRTWMDRNLGASQAATSSTDEDSYGDLYQFGRAADGHQCRNSPLHDGENDGLATTSAPNTGEDWDGHFIRIDTPPNDWLVTQDNFLWNTNDPTNANDPSPGKGATDPCPTGYRLPTEAELNAERSSWSSNNIAGAFASPLKLPATGNRNFTTGSLINVGSVGDYWSSTVSGTNARNFFILSSFAGMDPNFRANGFSVRCIKD